MHLKYCFPSLPQLRHAINLLNEDSHPGLVHYLRIQCYHQVKTGNQWSELDTTELDLLVLQHVCHRRHLIRQLQDIISRSDALTRADLHQMQVIMCELAKYKVSDEDLPVSRQEIFSMLQPANKAA